MKSELIRRYIVYIVGLYVFSLGIALVARTTLGATPVSSWAFTMSRHTALTYGTYSFLIHLAMITYQVVILIGHGLRKELFNIALQLPFSFLFGVFLDLNMYLTASINPSTIVGTYSLLAIACMVHAFGVFMQITARITMMSAEAFVYYTCLRWKFAFWKTKIFFDVSMVVLAIVTSLLFEFSIASISMAIGIGTLIDALMVGRIYRFYSKHFHILNVFISWDRKTTYDNLR